MANLDTYVKLQNRVLAQLGTDRAADRTLAKEYINEAGQDVWLAYPWWERRKSAFVACVAPYTTGTVVTTKGSTAATLTGGVWPAAAATRPYKFAAGYNGPWYDIATRTNDTVAVLSRVWAETSLAASTYVCYDDRIPLATDVATLNTNDVVLFSSSGSRLQRLSYAESALLPWATSSGVPSTFNLLPPVSGVMHLRLGPHTPDDIYNVYYGYLTTHTEMSNDSDAPVVPSRLRDALVSGALMRAYKEEPFKDTDAYERERRAFEATLTQSIVRERRENPKTHVIKTFDHGSTVSGSWVVMPRT